MTRPSNDNHEAGSARRASPRTLGRRQFLRNASAGIALAAGTRAGASLDTPGRRALLAAATEGHVRKRPLGKTGLMLPEVSFGGHSWAYEKVPNGRGGFRKPSVEEAAGMIAAGLDMGVNFFDACTPREEHSLPAKAFKRLGIERDRYILSARLCHRQHGGPEDKKAIEKFLDRYLRFARTDYFDIMMLSNVSDDTPRSGLWQMEHSIEALAKAKKEGKIRFTGFGSHFTPDGFLYAFKHYGKEFDLCSMPYNTRHRAAEKLFPIAKDIGLGVVTIKPFARGSLLEDRDLHGPDSHMPRDMIAFILENEHVDACICGVHTLAHVKENFSASWTPLTGERRGQLTQVAADTPVSGHTWLEEGWISA